MRGWLMSWTAVAIALALAGQARATVEQHDLDRDGLRSAAAENKALRRYLKYNGYPDVAEMKPILDQPPWDDHEVTLYYFKSRKEISFARARVLGRPEVYSTRYERVMTDADIRAMQSRPKVAVASASKQQDPSACTGSASTRAACAADRAESAADRVDAAAADRTEAVVEQMAARMKVASRARSTHKN